MECNLSNNKTTEDIYCYTENTWDYEDEDEGEFSGEKFNYHFVFGNEKIVFIKAGAGGSQRGYEDKYIKMAQRIHKRMGATVICASNPIDPICDAPDVEEIRWVANSLGYENFELYLIGVSDGAYLNINLARKFPETVKWVGINSSFAEVSDLEDELKSISDVFKLMIYGTKDDDFDRVILELRKMHCDNLAFEFIDNADHNFTDMLDKFIALADYL